MWCYTQRVHDLCNHRGNTSSLCCVASHRDKPPCGAEDFLCCYEHSLHISNHTAFIADNHNQGCHHIKLVCFWSLTVVPCNEICKLESITGLVAFSLPQVCVVTTQQLWPHKAHRVLICVTKTSADLKHAAADLRSCNQKFLLIKCDKMWNCA